MADMTSFQKQQLACAYATLLLSDAAQDITSDSIASVVKAANISVDKLFLDTFARFVTPEIAEDLVSKVSKVGSGAPAAGGAAPAAEAAVEAAPEESEEESDVSRTNMAMCLSRIFHNDLTHRHHHHMHHYRTTWVWISSDKRTRHFASNNNSGRCLLFCQSLL